MFPVKGSRGLALAALLVCSILLPGQAVTGSITGIVTDPSGSLVRGAQVTVTDLERNTTFTATTNGAGLYVIRQLLPSRYRVQAETPGFRTYTLENLPLATDQTATVNIVLQVGNVSQQLTVQATPQLVEPSSSTLSAVVGNRRIVDLPLNGRNIYTLTSLVPGVFQTHTNSGIDDTFYGNHFIINGSQEATSDIILDGVSAEVNHNIPTIPAISAIPSVEGIQEFRILTNSYPAEYGRSGGGVVIMSTKSGTNTPHGSAFEFLRNSFFDANNFHSGSGVG